MPNGSHFLEQQGYLSDYEKEISRLRDECNALRAALQPTWLPAPDGPGWYWTFPVGDEPECVKVVRSVALGGELRVDLPGSRGLDIDDFAGFWMRIVPPEMPPAEKVRADSDER